MATDVRLLQPPGLRADIASTKRHQRVHMGPSNS